MDAAAREVKVEARRRLTAVAGTLSLAAALSLERAARADCASDAHLSTCFEADTLWPHAGSSYFNFVGGTQTSAPGTVSVGLVSTYARRPITLRLPTGSPGVAVGAVDHLVDSTLVFGVGLAPRLEATAALSVTAYRRGSGLSAITSQHTSPLALGAMRDARIGAAYRLLGDPADERRGGDLEAGAEAAPTRDAHIAALPRLGGGGGPGWRYDALARFELSLPTGDESSFSGERSAVAIPSVAASAARGPFIAAVEVGSRLRATADLLGSRVGPQLYLGLGVGADLVSQGRLGVLLEAFALPTLAAQRELAFDSAAGARVPAAGRPPLVPAEWALGVRSAELVARGVSLTAEAGTALNLAGEAALTAPRYRATLSLRYAPPEPECPVRTPVH